MDLSLFFPGLSGNFSHLGQAVHHSDSLSAARVVQTPAAPPVRVRARTLYSLSGGAGWEGRGRGNVGGWNVADDSFQAAKLSWGGEGAEALEPPCRRARKPLCYYM